MHAGNCGQVCLRGKKYFIFLIAHIYGMQQCHASSSVESECSLLGWIFYSHRLVGAVYNNTEEKQCFEIQPVLPLLATHECLYSLKNNLDDWSHDEAILAAITIGLINMSLWLLGWSNKYDELLIIVNSQQKMTQLFHTCSLTYSYYITCKSNERTTECALNFKQELAHAKKHRWILTA